MKTVLYTIAFLVSFTLLAQKKEKVKGNKNVVEIFENLDPYNQIEIMDGLEVTLMQTSSEGYRLKTDSNLVNVIKLNVVDSVLKVYTTHKIASNKALEIDITFFGLDKMVIHEDAKVIGKNYFNLNDLTLNSMNASNFSLDIKAGFFMLQMNGKAKGKLKLNSQSTTVKLEDKANLKGTISTNELDAVLTKNADLTIEGDSETLDLEVTGSSVMNARNLKTTKASIIASHKSDIYIYASKNLSLYAKDRSSVYVYGNPEIKVDGLNDKSKIIKK